MYLVKTVVLSSSSTTIQDSFGLSGGLPQCQSFDAFDNPIVQSSGDNACSVPFMYSPNGEDYDEIMKIFAEESSLIFNSQVKGMPNQDSMINYMYSNQGVVGFGILLDISPESISYKILYNKTQSLLDTSWSWYYSTSTYGPGNLESNPPTVLLNLQSVIESSIISYQSGSTVSINPTINLWPVISLSNNLQITSTSVGTLFIIFTTMGPVLINIAFILFSIVILNLVVREKEAELLTSLRRIGLNESAHAWSWFVVIALISFLSSIIVTTLGTALNIYYFSQTEYLINFFLFFLYGLCIGALALFFSAFVRSGKIMNLLIFILLAFALVFTLVICIILQIYIQSNMNIDEFLFSPNASPALTFFYSILPWFHLMRVFLQIIQITKVQGWNNVQTKGAILSKHFTWDDLYSIQNATYSDSTGSKNLYFLPTIVSSFYNLAILTAVYLFFSWYLSVIIHRNQPVWFLFQKEFWGWEKDKIKVQVGDTIAKLQEKSREEGNIVLYNLSKSYANTTAVKELNLVMLKNQCFCLLGENGSGKTTTINMLTGLFPPTNGCAFIFGLDAANDVPLLQNIIGICPQDDVLWPELSAREHFELYARFKGMNTINKYVTSKLIQFDLNRDADKASQTFSGGMKRRLSVGLASVGDPHFILLDEPTTGMDPLSRKRVWTMIEDLKKNHILLLTTHAMEEAERLGDSVAILSNGMLRAQGTPLFLKNRFGSGYQISLLTNPENLEKLSNIVKQNLPGADFIESATEREKGSLTVGVPKTSKGHIPYFFAAIEKEEFVKEWGVCNSTLEEVFLKLVKSNKAVTEMGETALTSSIRKVTLLTKNLVPVIVSGNFDLTWADKEKDGVPTEKDLILDGVESKLSTTSAITDFDSETMEINPLLSSKHNEPLNQLAITAPPNNENNNNNPSVNVPITSHPQKRKPVSVFQQSFAIFMKNIALSAKNRCTNCCYFCFAIIMIIISIINAKLIIPNSSPYTPTTATCEGQNWYAINSGQNSGGNTACSISDIQSFINQSSITESSTYTCDKGGQGQSNLPFPPNFAQSGQQNTCYFLQSNFYEFAYNAGSGGGIPVLTNTKGVINFENFPLFNATYSSGIMQNLKFQFKVSADKADNIVSNIQNKVIKNNVTNLCTVCSSYFTYECQTNNNINGFYGGLTNDPEKEFNSIYPTFSVDLSFNGNEFSYTVGSFFLGTTPSFSYYNTPQDAIDMYYNNNYSSSPSSYCNSITVETYNDFNRMFNYNNLINIGILSQTSQASFKVVTGAISPLPIVVFTGTGIVNSLGTESILMPLTLMSMFPLTMQRFVTERTSNLLFMMRTAGLSTTAYFVGNYIYDFSTFTILNFIYFGFGYILGSDTIRNLPFYACFILLILFAHSLVGFSYFFSILFRNVRIASIVAYLLIIIVGVSSFVIDRFSSSVPSFIYFIPPLGFARSACTLMKDGVGSGLFFYPNSLILTKTGLPIVYMFIGGTVCLIISCIVVILSDETFSWELPCWNKEHHSFNKAEQQKGSKTSSLEREEDLDVKNERVRVETGNTSNDAIVMKNLYKIFTGRGSKVPAKIAVNNISFGVQYGDIFGLLGPNGAGKTTTLSILSGLLKSTSGDALVASFSTKSELVYVHQIMGICPQFNLLFDELTVKEHLEFYCRLKGVKSNQIRGTVQQAAEAVLLEGDFFNKKSMELSGGGKRRLSIGISFIGDPSVVFLDEPSTGLDPSSRKDIWDIIKKFCRRPNKCIVITTHSMEEADALCSKIGIVAGGSLRCLGTQLRLKNRFGQGYRLVVQYENANIDDGFIFKEISPTAILEQKLASTCYYVIPSNTIKVSVLFATMDRLSKKSSYGIKEWGLNYSTLEEVFLKIAAQAESEN